MTDDVKKDFDGATMFYEDVVNYATATGETKARMDQLIESINWEDLNTITTFAKEPTDVLMKSSEEIVRRAQTASSFLGGFSQFKEKLANFDFEAVGEMAAAYAKKAQRKMALATLAASHPIQHFFKKIWFALTGMGKKDTSMDDIRHEIDKSMLQMGEVVAGLEESKDKIPGIVSDLQTQEKNRLTAYSEYGLYIGAALEKYNRLKAEVSALANETSPLKQSEMRGKRIAVTVLNTKLTDMNSFHKSCLVQLKTIDDLQEALAMGQLKIDSHLTISQGQWMALLGEASTAAQVSEIAETIRAADEFGDKIFEQSQKLSDMTKVMMRSAFEHGTLDPVKVIAALQKRTQDIQEDLVYVETFNRKMEAQRGALDEAARQFREAAAKVTAAPAALTQQASDAVALPAAVPSGQKPSI